MNNDEFKGLAKAKKLDARLLLANRRYSNAYYLYGYSVELALKACITHQFLKDDIPDKKFVQDVYTHDIARLVALAGLSKELQKKLKDPEFTANWSIVTDWSEQSRYEMIDPARAHLLGDAIEDQDKGIMQWIKNYW